MRLEPRVTSFPCVAPPNRHKDCPLRKLVAWGEIGAAREWVVGGRGQAALGWPPEGSTLGFQTRERSALWRGFRGVWKQEERAVKAGGQGRGDRRWWRVSALWLLAAARRQRGSRSGKSKAADQEL